MVMKDLTRLFRAKNIAVVGGGAWCALVIHAAKEMGFTGSITPVNPKGAVIGGQASVTSVADLPIVPDAVFLGVNRHATIELVAQLSAMGAGGAICFASGFTEAMAEDDSGADLQADLVAAAGEMPIMGPNCYGFVNALDQVALWPDQHGLRPVDSGVAILTQSSNIGINLTFQARGLPIAYMIACGNMAQTTAAEIAQTVVADDRVTALGIYAEGFGDLPQWETFAKAAHAAGKPVVVIKSGRSEQAAAAAVSHTASLAGQDAGAQAFLNRLGFARVFDLPTFLETLNVLHMTGGLPEATLASISCSGGEAGLIADMAEGSGVTFPALTETQHSNLRDALGPKVALANPLDYHTYIWRDVDAMTQAWGAMADGPAALTVTVVDYPTTDPTDWVCATQAALRAHAHSGKPVAVAATLGELMPDESAAELRAGGVIPVRGLAELLGAVRAAAAVGSPVNAPVLLPRDGDGAVLIAEDAAKAMLAAHGVSVPQRIEAETATLDASHLRAPFAVKAVGLAHKSDSGGVKLNVSADGLADAAQAVGTPRVLIEEMITGGVAELLVSVLHDPAHGFLLTVGAGGTLTELWQDSASLLVPSDRAAVHGALNSLRIAPLLAGYRGADPADMNSVIDLIMSVQDFVTENAANVREVELNPVICAPDRCVAVDALIRVTTEENK
jgi:acetyl-CoA synthetase